MYISAIANAFMKEAEPLQQYLLEKAAKTENWVCILYSTALLYILFLILLYFLY